MSEMALNGVRTLLVVFVAGVGGVSPVCAQQSEPSSASLDRIRAALQNSQQLAGSDGVGVSAPLAPDGFRWGVLTLLPPDTRGQFVRVRVPVGAFATRAVHSITAAHQHRAESAARHEVAKALAEFKKAQ